MNDVKARHSDSQDAVDLTKLKSQWGVYTHGDLKQRRGEIGNTEYLIEGLIPARSVGIIVGDSGLGKSALLYQVAVCIAAGVDFLGRKVKQGRVLVMDYENGLGQVDDMVSAITKHLGVSMPTENLLLWNFNDCPSRFGQSGSTAIDLIRDAKPCLVILDSFTAYRPDIEESNPGATTEIKRFRVLNREYHSSVLGSHHLKKPTDFAPSLEDVKPRSWLLQARGAGALINATDVRLAVEEPRRSKPLQGAGGTQEEVALVMRGFARVRGEVPVTYITRTFDEDGRPLGYSKASGACLLFNKDQETAFANLPERFRFKDAQRVYGKGAQATTDFLNKCISLGLIQKADRRYEKVASEDSAGAAGVAQ
jgi:hypothetical protein